jgi:BetI-type transcriptional repressor, C-terminal
VLGEGVVDAVGGQVTLLAGEFAAVVTEQDELLAVPEYGGDGVVRELLLAALASEYDAVVPQVDHQLFVVGDEPAAARVADDPWAALLDTVDLLAAPATEPLVPALVMEAMIQAYRDPELEALLSREQDEERFTVTTLLRNAAEAGQIDPGLDVDDTAAWVMALIAALYTSAATDPSFAPAAQLPTLRLIIERFLRPATPA